MLIKEKKVAIRCQNQRRVTGVLGFVVSVFAWDIDMNKAKLLPLYLVLQASIILYKRWLRIVCICTLHFGNWKWNLLFDASV
ncbi:hypothetical protein E1A91_A07G124100v1 [Gossypium mustelinum]|uniref:Uncharacterized protein n=1 Tax=Gossypium mustelinum TaxID=34275 RepID=A0A5D2YK34_GOSMU|nr:hypothetical protein E1A91_A07G124100v1 [Gossypium mustelinum]